MQRGHRYDSDFSSVYHESGCGCSLCQERNFEPTEVKEQRIRQEHNEYGHIRCSCSVCDPHQPRY